MINMVKEKQKKMAICELEDHYYKKMKFRIFYYDPNDLRIFITSAAGTKTQVNWARWQAWVFILAVLALVIIGTYFF